MNVKNVIIKYKISIDFIKNKYSFLNISDNDMDNLIKDIISNKIDDTSKFNDVFRSNIISSIEEVFKEKTIEKLNSKELPNILNNYINIRTNNNFNEEEILMDIFNFLNDYNVILNDTKVQLILRKCKIINKIIGNELSELNDYSKYDDVNLNLMFSEYKKTLIDKSFKNQSNSKEEKLIPIKKDINPKNEEVEEIEIDKEENIDDILKEIEEEGITEDDVLTKFDEYESSVSDDNFKLFLRDVNLRKVYTESDNRKLLEKYSEASEEDKLKIKNKIVEHNLKLVIYFVRGNGKIDTILDLIQEGTFGLMRAVELYDPSKGFNFSTYASYHIKSKIKRHNLQVNKNIRLPENRVVKINKLKQIRENFILREGRLPSILELSELTSYKPSEIENFLDEYSNATGYTISINELVSNDGEDELGAFIPDKDKLPEEQFIDKEFIEEIEKMLNQYITNKKHIEMIKYRFGFYDDKIYTLEEISEKFGLTNERIRQCIESELVKLRKNSSVKNNVFFSEYKGGVLKKIKNRSMSYNKTIYEEYLDYPKSRVEEIINIVSKNHLELLQKRYGLDYEVPYTGNDVDTEEYKENAIRLRTIMNRAFKKRSKVIKYENLQIEMPTIYDEYNYVDREKLDLIIKYVLYKHYELITYRYGKKLDKPVILYNDPTEYYISRQETIKEIMIELINRVNSGEVLEYVDTSSTIEMRKRRGRPKKEKEENKKEVLEIIKEDNLETTGTKKKKTNNRTVYEEFLKYNKEDVDKALLLTEIDHKEKLLMKYGPNYNVVYDCDKTTQEYKVNSRKVFEIMNYHLKKYDMKEEYRKSIVYPTLYEFFHEYTPEEINYVVKYVSKLYEDEIKYLFGDDLSAGNSENYNTTAKYKMALKNMRVLLRTHLRRYREDSTEYEKGTIFLKRKKIENKTIYEEFKSYKIEALNAVIDKIYLLHRDKFLMRYGDDLNQFYDCDTTTEEYKNNAKTLRNLILKNLSYYENDPEEYVQKEKRVVTGGKKTIYEEFNMFTKEDVDIVINYLDIRYHDMLILKYGPDYNVVYDCDKTTEDYKDNSYRLRKILKLHFDRYNKDSSIYINAGELPQKTIYEEYDKYPVDVIDLVVSFISIKHKDKVIKRYGNDLNIPNEEVLNTDQDKRSTYKLRNLIQYHLQKYDIDKDNFYNVYGNKSNSEAIKNIPEEIEVLETEEVFEIENVIEELECLDIIEKKLPVTKKEESIPEHFQNANGIDYTLLSVIDSLKDREKKIVSLTLCYPASAYYSYEDIASLFDVEVKYVALVTQKVLLLYQEKVNSMVESNIESVRQKIEKLK